MFRFIGMDVLLQELELLVIFKLSLLGTEWVVVAQLQEEIFIEKGLCFLPLKLVSVSLADLLSSVAQQIKDCLEDSTHAYNVHFLEAQNAVFPLLWLQWVILRVVFVMTLLLVLFRLRRCALLVCWLLLLSFLVHFE